MALDSTIYDTIREPIIKLYIPVKCANIKSAASSVFFSFIEGEIRRRNREKKKKHKQN